MQLSGGGLSLCGVQSSLVRRSRRTRVASEVRTRKCWAARDGGWREVTGRSLLAELGYLSVTGTRPANRARWRTTR